jgi:hypothetical protein
MSKLATVTRGRDTLLPQNLALHAEGMSKRSITPTTHKQRDVFKDTADMQVAASTGSPAPSDMQDGMFYQDTYSHPTWQAPVLHFGINGHYAPMYPVLAQHNAMQQQKMTAGGTSVITNASNATEYPKFVQRVTLTQYEQDLMHHAMHYLAASSVSAASATGMKKVVLVDTFPRTLKANPTKALNVGDIEIPSGTEPLPTHAVVLYCNTKGQILVIDPNSPQFSGHLQHIQPLSSTTQVLVSSNPSELHKPYSPKATSTPPNTGPDKAKYRDCVDIAVKLAALLDLDPTDYTSHDQVMQSGAVRLVSNALAITRLDIPADNPLRIKQVSHLGLIRQINDDLLRQSVALVQKIKDALAIRKAEEIAAKQKYEATEAQANMDYGTDVSGLIGQVAQHPELADGDYV